MFPFGHGLSYAYFDYENLRLSTHELRLGETLTVSVELRNTSAIAASEVAQLYVRDRIGTRTRPVRELKGFQRLRLAPGASERVRFELSSEGLAFFDGRSWVTEPGEFAAWVAVGRKAVRRPAGRSTPGPTTTPAAWR